MTKEEARLYLELLYFAWSEGQADEESFQLGKKLRDKLGRMRNRAKNLVFAGR